MMAIIEHFHAGRCSVYCLAAACCAAYRQPAPEASGAIPSPTSLAIDLVINNHAHMVASRAHTAILPYIRDEKWDSFTKYQKNALTRHLATVPADRAFHHKAS
jgi:hypothetical protein